MIRVAVPAAFLLLAGCATGGEFPSLAPRPAENLPIEEPVRVDPVVPTDAALRTRIQALLAEARGGDAAFEAEYGRALPRIRAAGRPASDSWIQAQEAISRIEAARVRTSNALADLDALVIARVETPTNADDHAALLAAQEAAQALLDGQNRRLAELRQRIGG